jgi:hypothetical protein
MTRVFPAICVASALALGASVSAQQPAPNQPARNDGVTTPNDFEQSNSRSGATDTLVLTGCLDRASNGTYELRNARMSAPGANATGSASATSPGAAAGSTASTTGSPNGTVGTTGTTTGATATTSPTTANRAPTTGATATWILKSTTDLAPHVGHQVQVTGRPSAPAGTAGSNTATTSNPTTTTTGARVKDAGDDARSVDVQAVRMISQSCP